jgi:RNA polymerase sigma factor (sigma-70 family)
MATIGLDMNGQGVAVQSYQDKVQQLTDVIVRYLARFRRIALRLLGNIADAEDAVQDAFVSAFAHLDQFRGQATMSTWLTSIVINAARMKLRQRSRQAQISLDETTESRTFCSQRCCQSTNQTPKRYAAGGNLPKNSPTRQHNSRLRCVRPFNFGMWTA